MSTRGARGSLCLLFLAVALVCVVFVLHGDALRGLVCGQSAWTFHTCLEHVPRPFCGVPFTSRNPSLGTVPFTLCLLREVWLRVCLLRESRSGSPAWGGYAPRLPSLRLHFLCFEAVALRCPYFKPADPFEELKFVPSQSGLHTQDGLPLCSVAPNAGGVVLAPLRVHLLCRFPPVQPPSARQPFPPAAESVRPARSSPAVLPARLLYLETVVVAVGLAARYLVADGATALRLPSSAAPSAPALASVHLLRSPPPPLCPLRTASCRFSGTVLENVGPCPREVAHLSRPQVGRPL